MSARDERLACCDLADFLDEQDTAVGEYLDSLAE
jgi:hypothetical protein